MFIYIFGFLSKWVTQFCPQKRGGDLAWYLDLRPNSAKKGGDLIGRKGLVGTPPLVIFSLFIFLGLVSYEIIQLYWVFYFFSGAVVSGGMVSSEASAGRWWLFLPNNAVLPRQDIRECWWKHPCLTGQKIHKWANLGGGGGSIYTQRSQNTLGELKWA